MFKDIFKDHNDYNEKSIVGFFSFIMLILTLLLDIISGWMGRDFTIHEFIFDGFLILTLGSFGIASLDKFISLKNTKGRPDDKDMNSSTTFDQDKQL